MNQADILAIKVAVQNVAQAQQRLNAIKQQLNQLDQANAKSARQQLSLIQRLRQGWQNLRKSQDGARSGGASIMGTWGKLAAVFTTTAAAAGTLYASIKSFETLSNTTKGLSNLLGPDAAKSILAQSRALADLTGTRATELFPQIQKLAGTGEVGSSDLIPTLRAFMALGKRSGASNEGLTRAFEQFTQIASQGQLQGDELRSIQENGVQLRALLKKAGLGDRIGSQTNPITFKEIQKALLQFGNSADATKYLSIGSDNATASLNRLVNVLQLDVLPVLGKVLTPAVVELANMLREYVSSIGEAKLRQLGKNIAQAVLALGKLALEALPVVIDLILAAAPVITSLIQSFKDLNDLTGGKLLKTLMVIAGLKFGAGIVGNAVGSGAGSAIGGWITGVALPFIIAMARKLIAFVLYQGVGLALRAGLTWLAEALAVLGTAVAGASAAVIAAVVAVGAAIGLAIGWLINQIPGVQNAQRAIGEWWNDTFGGGTEAKERAAKADPAYLPGGRIYEKRKAEGKDMSGWGGGTPTAQSARRSDPQRLVTEAGANGIRYSR